MTNSVYGSTGFETPGHHPDDLPVHLDGERIAIFGMGRVGLSAYNDPGPSENQSVTGAGLHGSETYRAKSSLLKLLSK